MTTRHMHKARISSAGLTLVEVQIAMLVTFLILAASVSLYTLYRKTAGTGNTVLNVYSNSRTAIALLARDIRSAAQVESSYGSYTTTNSSIVLKVPAVNIAGDVVIGQYDEIIYRLQGTDLYRIVIPSSQSARPASNRAVAHNCTSITFSSGGVALADIGSSGLSNINTVAIRLPISETIVTLSGAGTVIESMTPTTVIRLRNK